MKTHSQSKGLNFECFLIYQFKGLFCLIEMVLLSTPHICFGWEIRFFKLKEQVKYDQKNAQEHMLKTFKKNNQNNTRQTTQV